MAGIHRLVRMGLMFGLVGVFAIPFFEPDNVSADTNLVIGEAAVVAYAGGDQVRMREDIGYEAPIVSMLDEGTWITVQDGPFTDTDGNYWYQVSNGEPPQTGYIVSDYLALESGVSLQTVATTEEEPEAVSAPVLGDVVGYAYVAGTNGDGVRCRVDASTAGAVLTVVPEGTQIELIGPDIGGWQPINCGGGSGYISSQFVSWDAPGEAVAADPVPETPAPTDETTDTPTQSEIPTAPETSTEDAPQASQPTGAVTGTAFVSGTNGDGVRCRDGASTSSRIITVLRDGLSVDLAGDPVDVWQPVYCAGVGGYVHTDYLSATADDAASNTTETTSDAPDTSNEDAGTTTADTSEDVVAADQAVGGPVAMGVVTGTNGDGVRCRNDASFSAAIIGVLGEGSDVSMRGSPSGVWDAVTCFGQSGYVHSDYLSVGGDSTVVTDSSESAGNTASSSTGSAMVDSSGGLNCRDAASMSGSVIMVLSDNSSVSLRSGSKGSWQAVVCSGQDGYAYDTYLDYQGTDSTAGSEDSSSNSGTSSSSGAYASGSMIQITGTGGGGLRLRSAAGFNGSIMSVIGEGKVVEVRSGSTSNWIAVTYNGSNGFVSSNFVEAYSGSDAPSTSEPETTNTDTSSNSGMGNGDHASTQASLRLRYDSNFSAGIAAVAPFGTVVLITGAAENGFYPVDWDGLTGYMHGDYLSATSAGLSERGGSASQPSAPPSTTQTGSISGNSIVDYALRYVGYPYVWATHGPYSFDCSGFTNWVISNVLGKQIWYSVDSQWGYGTPVSRGNLQPGDVVFFQNTYKFGLSHVGIYIGGGQFVHAGNESTGVLISDLDSSYYSSRWYGARRMG